MHSVVLFIFCVIVILIPKSSQASSYELNPESIVALDDIRQSGLKSVVKQNVLILNQDSRIIFDNKDIIDSKIVTDSNDIPFLKLSIWRFFKEKNGMNFCAVQYCADPSEFEYKFDSDHRICFVKTDWEIAGCYSLVSKNNLLEWFDKEGNHVMTTFAAIYVENVFQLEKIWTIVRAHWDHELTVLGNHKETIIGGLISLGLLEPSPKQRLDVSVRAAIVTFQRKANILPTGFVGKETFNALQKSIK